jgi:acetyl esterase/lipase
VPAPFFTHPRLTGMSVAPDGRWYVLELDVPSTAGVNRCAVPVDAGDAHPRFAGWDVTALPDRCVLHLAPADTGPPRTALWWRSLDSGRSVPLAAPPGGVFGYRLAPAAGCVVYATAMHSGAAADEDRLVRGRRAALGTRAVLHEPGDPVHHGGGGGQRIRLAGLSLGTDGSPSAGCLLPEPPGARLRGSFTVDAVARRVVAESAMDSTGRFGLLLAERCGTDERWHWCHLVEDDRADFASPVLSPDGRWLACVRTSGGPADPATPLSPALWLLDLTRPADGGRPLAPDLDRWPTSTVWTPDGAGLYVTADCAGHRPVYLAEAATGAVRRLTGTGSYTGVQVCGPDVYAIRSAVDRVPAPVRLRPDGPPGGRRPRRLAGPAPQLAVPGHLHRVSAGSGRSLVRGWLCRPDPTPGQPPAPLLVWLHGGPRASWTGWSWRWCPWLAVARGYAVLLPDPAPSTGYGRAFVHRAWGDWADTPCADVMRLVDRTAARPDVDGSRIAVMGGSYGGFLAYHLVARSDRFRAAVVHAGIWDLAGFVDASTMARAFHGEFGHPLDVPKVYAHQSPRSRAARIRVPLLLSHGSQDPVVPFTQALTAWGDLRRLATPVRLLQFPDEPHDIVKPGNVQVWYECVFAFLDHTLHGRDWQPPAALV